MTQTQSAVDISELERRYIIESIIAALVEIEQSADFSQQIADDLYETLRILGVSRDEIEQELSR